MEEIPDAEPQRKGEVLEDSEDAIVMSEEEYRRTLKRGYGEKKTDVEKRRQKRKLWDVPIPKLKQQAELGYYNPRMPRECRQ